MRVGLEKAAGTAQKTASPGVDWTQVKEGDRICVLAGGREGSLASLPDRRGRVEVQVGGARIVCRLADLGPPEGSPRPRVPEPRWNTRREGELDVDLEGAVRTADNTLDLRGERVDEALDKVDQFLDDASMAGRAVVFILHGYGTGVLRKAVRAHLRQSPYACEQRSATRTQGGDALTAVKL